jgi:hypothetical protein
MTVLWQGLQCPLTHLWLGSVGQCVGAGAHHRGAVAHPSAAAGGGAPAGRRPGVAACHRQLPCLLGPLAAAPPLPPWPCPEAVPPAGQSRRPLAACSCLAGAPQRRPCPWVVPRAVALLSVACNPCCDLPPAGSAGCGAWSRQRASAGGQEGKA